jgi:hypothetical protein
VSDKAPDILGGVDGPPPMASMVRFRLERLLASESDLEAFTETVFRLAVARRLLARQPVTVGTKRGRSS